MLVDDRAPGSVAPGSRYAVSMRARLLVVTVAALLSAAACGNDPEPPDTAGSTAGGCVEEFNQPFDDVEAYPVFASSEVVVGKNRFLVGLLNQNDAPIGSPGIDMHIDFVDLDKCEEGSVSGADMDFIWTLEDVIGVYRTYVSFDSPGKWGAEVTIRGDGIEETVKANFEVAAAPTTPELGAQVPSVDTPTAADVEDLEQISTDEKPVPRFYEMSVAEALKKNEPFVVIFATPKFCQTQTCGPMLDIVKDVAEDYPKITFIHVEPYELPADTGNLQPVAAALKWKLPSEPWVFVVDRRGRLDAKYEGTLAPEELQAALKKL